MNLFIGPCSWALIVSLMSLKVSFPLHFRFSCSDTPSTRPVSGLQCFSAWMMKCALRKSSKMRLNGVKAASSPDTRAAATTWTCWNSTACRTWRRCLWHPGTSDSLLKMTTAERKHWLQVSVYFADTRSHGSSTALCWFSRWLWCYLQYTRREILGSVLMDLD